jgi:hypothetical protein
VFDLGAFEAPVLSLRQFVARDEMLKHRRMIWEVLRAPKQGAKSPLPRRHSGGRVVADGDPRYEFVEVQHVPATA